MIKKPKIENSERCFLKFSMRVDIDYLVVLVASTKVIFSVSTITILVRLPASIEIVSGAILLSSMGWST